MEQTHSVVAADLNGDSLLDINTTNFDDNSLIWYRNDGNGGFMTGILYANLGSGGFNAHTIDTSALGARTIATTNIDGDVDALAASVMNDTIAWYINDGKEGFMKQVIDLATNGAYGIFTIDIDNDGDGDVLSPSFGEFYDHDRVTQRY